MSLELTNTQSTLCRLISAAMFQNHETFTEDADWNAVHQEMRNQAVRGLVKDLLPELPMPEELKKIWRKECFQVIASGIRLRNAQEDFLQILEAGNIPYVILKGTAAAMYYPNPMLREMGDVDVYVPERFHEKVRELLLKESYQQQEGNEHYKRHSNFSKDGIEYELHRRFATINSLKEKKYIDGLLEECCSDLQKTVRIVQGEATFCSLPGYVNGLVLLEHIGQHLIAGLGLRQIIDWMMFVSTALHDDKWPEFQKMARNAGLETLAKAVTKMCVRYFGLKGSFGWCMDVDERISEEILAYLFDSGNFGLKKREDGKVSTVENRIKNKRSLIVALQTAGEINWKLYKRHRWLKPFAWVYQIVRYTSQVLTSPDGIRMLSKGTAEANRRAKLMKDLDIYRK